MLTETETLLTEDKRRRKGERQWKKKQKEKKWDEKRGKINERTI